MYGLSPLDLTAILLIPHHPSSSLLAHVDLTAPPTVKISESKLKIGKYCSPSTNQSKLIQCQISDLVECSMFLLLKFATLFGILAQPPITALTPRHWTAGTTTGVITTWARRCPCCAASAAASCTCCPRAARNARAACSWSPRACGHFSSPSSVRQWVCPTGSSQVWYRAGGSITSRLRTTFVA